MNVKSTKKVIYNLLNFILLGFSLGMAFLTKYAAIYFVISLILLLIKIRFSSKNVIALTQRQFRRVNT